MLTLSVGLLVGGTVHSIRPRALIFLTHDCPISRRYSPELNRIAARFRTEVDFKMVYCDQAVSKQSISVHHNTFKKEMPWILDPTRKLARAWGVRAVPTVVLLLANGKPAYFGRIDDAYGEDFKWRAPTVRNFDESIKSVLAGRAPVPSATKVIGCIL